MFIHQYFLFSFLYFFFSFLFFSLVFHVFQVHSKTKSRKRRAKIVTLDNFVQAKMETVLILYLLHALHVFLGHISKNLDKSRVCLVFRVSILVFLPKTLSKTMTIIPTINLYASIFSFFLKSFSPQIFCFFSFLLFRKIPRRNRR